MWVIRITCSKRSCSPRNSSTTLNRLASSSDPKTSSRISSERAGQAFSLLILDEVFGSLDEARRFNVVELLRGLQDRFEQVILITHIEPVREGVDQVIAVRYDADTGSSIVTESEGGEPAVREQRGFSDEREPRGGDRVGEESIETGAGAGA